ncbi:nitrate reductase molybdenum cofactor assembly chaperone [Desulfofundulus sp.]|uniref:nitrate reductase molybdenum cofactor assembly chaperone n=1 Tax=Desulfofundulus sp. TaxID=2282750 RepID=UPI003C73548E
MESEPVQTVFQLASHLLQYPDGKWREAVKSYRSLIAEIEEERIARVLSLFLKAVEQENPDKFSERYVQTFDFNKKTNLYLTYAQYGDHRQRGKALLQLKRLYERMGLVISERELPDYLPLMLEFAAVAPLDAAKEALSPYRVQIETIRNQLVKMENPYAWVLDAVLMAMDVAGMEHLQEGGHDSWTGQRNYSG